MSGFLIVDLYNALFQLTCAPDYMNEFSVRRLIRTGKVTVTEAADAFLHKILETGCLETGCNDFEIRLVVDSKQKRGARDGHSPTVVRNAVRTIDINVVRDAGVFILDLFSNENELPNYSKDDNVFIVTNDKKLRRNIKSAVARIPEHKRPHVRVYRVPTHRTNNPIIPIVIDVAEAKRIGWLRYLKGAPSCY